MSVSKAMMVAASAAAVLAGCTTEVAVETTPPPSVVAPQPPPPPPPPPAANTLALSLGGDAAAGGVQGELLAALRTTLSQRGYVLSAPGNAHASAVVSLTTAAKASLDDWHVYEGTALVKVEVGGEKPAIREKSFGAVGERKLGRAQAEMAVVKPLSGAISAWIESTIKERK